MEDIKELLTLIDRCPTPFHTVCTVTQTLESAGFIGLKETARWQLSPGKSYFVTRGGSALIAFRVPAAGWGAAHLVACHGDSPCLKLKENPAAFAAGLQKLNVEVYGGLNMSGWFDRPLSVAGRLVIREENGLRTVLADAGRELLVIPSVAVHQNRTVNDGYKYNPQVDLQPLFALGEKPAILPLLAEAAGVRPEEIVSAELFAYCRQPGFVFGAEREFYAAPRIDDLACVFTTLEGFVSAAPAGLAVWCVLDNEEVGSATKQGAAAPFLAQTLRRICRALGGDEEAFAAALPASFLLSADNAHAIHPNHPELYDAANGAQLGGGVVLKYSAAQKYTTDAVSAAVFREVCRRAGVPVQSFANRSDLPGGSTLGCISSTQLDVNAADIGLPQLAMHAACETAAVSDAADMTKAIRAFYELPLHSTGDGSFSF